MLTHFVTGILLGFAAAMQPGAFQAFLLAQTMRRGALRALPAAFAPLLSDGPIIVLTVVALRQLPAWMTIVLHLAGGGLLLFLAAKTLQAVLQPAATAIPPAGIRSNIFQAALVNVLNPGPYLYWSLVAGPLLLGAWGESPLRGLSLITGFYATMVITLIGLILIFHLAGRLGARVQRLLTGFSGLILAGFGIYLLLGL